jgi:peptidoglycan/xylan/chitin deacetylase (PgdA/CDA1 family)
MTVFTHIMRRPYARRWHQAVKGGTMRPVKYRRLVAMTASVVLISALPATSAAAPEPGSLPARAAGQAFTRLPVKQKVVALTFDAGAGAGGLKSILRTLKADGLPATFFLTGHWARYFPAKVARIARGGYVIGNHTDTHARVSTLSDRELRTELRATDRAVTAAARRGTGPWFRFPYGEHTPRDIARVNALGYACIQWTVDAAGWLGTSGGMSAQKVVDRVMAAVRPGAIILMHLGEHPTDGSTLDADALPTIVAALKARGYVFTTVEALLSPASRRATESAHVVSAQPLGMANSMGD